MLTSALRWMFPTQEIAVELRGTQSAAIAYLRDRVRSPSLATALTSVDAFVGRVDGEKIVLQHHCRGRQNLDAQQFRGRFTRRGSRHYIVGAFSPPRMWQVNALVMVSLLCVLAIVLLVRGAALAALFPALMVAVVLSQTRLAAWRTLDDIPVIERLLRDAAREDVA